MSKSGESRARWRCFFPVILALAATAGCGSDSDDGCPIPTGTWNIRYTEVSGDCGLDPFDALVAYDGTRESLEATPPGCTGARTLSKDSCTLTVALRCEIEDANGLALVQQGMGEFRFVADDRIEGLVENYYSTPEGDSCVSRQEVLGTPR